MHISLQWLSQYVDISDLAPGTLANSLTASGLEVEGIEVIGGAFDGVVVGKVQKIEPHPNADKLRLVSVQSDQAGTVETVVCGAPNVAEGMHIAFAKMGATVLNRKDGSSFTLTPIKIRGVASAGMVCSIEELGLETIFPPNDDGGIWPIRAYVGDEDIGKDLKDALNLTPDTVLVTAPTANRGDQMSYIGVAREVAALFDRPVKEPTIKTAPPSNGGAFTVTLEDPNLCRYYGAATLTGVSIGSSPDWMVKRLEAAGVRSINNVVDITNYVMLETGQPLHAFDAAKLDNGGTIGVRYAKSGETMTTLDDVERTLDSQTVVNTHNDKVIGLAGLMGGGNSEVSDTTTTLLLEAAYFTAPTNRRSARSVGLRTDANARFERGVDLGRCRQAMLRAVDLLIEHANASITALAESPPPALEAVSLTLRHQRLESILGLSIPNAKVQSVLEKLGFIVSANGTGANATYTVAVPTWRLNDVKKEIDLIEEVIRIYGYDNVPYTLPEKTRATAPSWRQKLHLRTRATLSGLGLQEVVTTSLLGPNLLERTGFTPDESKEVTLSNSHSSDHTRMRQSILPTLLDVAKSNQGQGSEDVWIYEIGRTYFSHGKRKNPERDSGVEERTMVSGLMMGQPLSGQWLGQRPMDFYSMKGAVEALINSYPNELNITTAFAAVDDIPYLHPGRAASVTVNGAKIGALGQLHPALQKSMKFRQPVYLFELNFDKLAKQCKPQTGAGGQATPVTVSSFPMVKRDMAFSAPDSVHHQTVMDTLAKLKEPLITHIELFDEYRGDQLPDGHRSLAYRVTLQSESATLTDSQADAVVQKMKETLSASLPVEFR